MNDPVPHAVPQQYRATRMFELGDTGMLIKPGKELGFDGTYVHISGKTYVFPQLRSAIKAGWLVLIQDAP